MGLESRQAGEFLQNQDIRELIDLLKQNSPFQGQEYAALLGQVGEMSRLLDKALRELQEVRAQLGGRKRAASSCLPRKRRRRWRAGSAPCAWPCRI